MPSNFAKKQLEKFGWTEGSGLGKNGHGITTFVKVQRRDPQLTSGIGHEASSGGTVNTDMGLDAMLSEIKAKKGASGKKRDRDDDHADNEANRDESPVPLAVSVPGTAASKRDRSPARPAMATSYSPRSGTAASSSSSAASSSDADDADGDTDVTKWDDKKLFGKCGGVRLGRSGRHRFFNGKLARIEKSHAEPVAAQADAAPTAKKSSKS
jgi:hypothetical protein